MTETSLSDEPAEAAATATADVVIPLEMRPALRLSAVSYGLVAGAVFLAVGLGFGLLTERYATPGDRAGFATQALSVLALVFGYTLAAWRWVSVETARDFQRLGVGPEGDLSRHPELALAVSREALAKSRVAGAAGIGIFLVLLELPGLALGAPPLTVWSQWHAFSFHLVGGILWFWVAGRLAYLSVAGGDWFKRDFEVDLLDLDPLRAAGRIAVRGSVAWVLGMSIASLVLLNPEIQQRVSLVVVVPMLLLTVALTAASMLIPVRGLRQRIGHAKRRELGAVEAAIRGVSGALEGTRLAARGGAPPGLADLIAYQGLVEAVPEWPFEGAAVRRLGLYLLIPLASWVGGALVERFVNVVLE